MPRYDRTGPEGKGPKTGRGLGKCNPGNAENTNDNNSRRFFGLGLGLGLGRGRRGRQGRGRR
jgi:hypothetical protein